MSISYDDLEDDGGDEDPYSDPRVKALTLEERRRYLRLPWEKRSRYMEAVRNVGEAESTLRQAEWLARRARKAVDETESTAVMILREILGHDS